MSVFKIEIDDSLISQYKLSIGDFNGNELDNYYKNFLSMAKGDLLTDDISEAALNTEIGRAAIILYAECLMNKQDVATNPTLTLLKNKLSIMTKGE